MNAGRLSRLRAIMTSLRKLGKFDPRFLKKRLVKHIKPIAAVTAPIAVVGGGIAAGYGIGKAASHGKTKISDLLEKRKEKKAQRISKEMSSILHGKPDKQKVTALVEDFQESLDELSPEAQSRLLGLLKIHQNNLLALKRPISYKKFVQNKLKEDAISGVYQSGFSEGKLTAEAEFTPQLKRLRHLLSMQPVPAATAADKKLVFKANKIADELVYMESDAAVAEAKRKLEEVKAIRDVMRTRQADKAVEEAREILRLTLEQRRDTRKMERSTKSHYNYDPSSRHQTRNKGREQDIALIPAAYRENPDYFASPEPEQLVYGNKPFGSRKRPKRRAE